MHIIDEYEVNYILPLIKYDGGNITLNTKHGEFSVCKDGRIPKPGKTF